MIENYNLLNVLQIGSLLKYIYSKSITNWYMLSNLINNYLNTNRNTFKYIKNYT